MSVKAPNQSESVSVAKGKLEKADSFLGVTYKLLAICGLAGTAFVWMAANFYTGELVVLPDKEPQFVEVKVYDTKGEATVFHTKNVSLMPGNYHVEVSANGGKSQHSDIQVAFGKKSAVAVFVDDSLTSDSLKGDSQKTQDEDADYLGGSGKDSGGRKWWRFWR